MNCTLAFETHIGARRVNQDRLGTAYTVTVDAAEGVTTGMPQRVVVSNCAPRCTTTLPGRP